MRFSLLSFLVIGLGVPLAANAAERSLFSGYAGTVPAAKEDQATTYFNRPEVRRLLAALENDPVSETATEQLLVGTGTNVADLERLKLVRSDKGYLRLSFAYFTANDMDLIHAVAAKYVPGLVEAIKTKAPAMDAIVARYPVSSVDKKRLAFVLTAGFGLNWDALDLLEKRRYRAPILVQGPGWKYSFWASEEVPNYSYKGYYWGSSTFPVGAQNLDPPLDFAFSSFGDPLSDPRMNFPDLFALPAEQMTPTVKDAAQKLGLQDDNTLGLGLTQVVGLTRARSIGALLFALRNGADSKDKLCGAPDAADASECEGELGLLAATGYVAQSDNGQFALLVPVLDMKDKPMLDSALALERAVIADWLKQNYTPMRRELLRLTAVRQGVPYPALFTQIWHEFFGLTTRELAAQGLIEDPYDKSVVWQGSIPVVWRTRLYHHDWE